MANDAELVRGWLSRLDPASEQYPPIVVTRAIARLASPDRAAALRDVETLLRQVDDVMTNEDDGDQAEPVRFPMPTDQPSVGTSLSPGDLAALIVDRVLGAEQDGGAASS